MDIPVLIRLPWTELPHIKPSKTTVHNVTAIVSETYQRYSWNLFNMNTTERIDLTSLPPLHSDDIVFYTFNIGLICLISVVNIVGNTLVIQSVLRHRTLKVPGNYFILSLACSDLITGIVYPFYNVSHMVIGDVLNALGK